MCRVGFRSNLLWRKHTESVRSQTEKIDHYRQSSLFFPSCSFQTCSSVLLSYYITQATLKHFRQLRFGLWGWEDVDVWIPLNASAAVCGNWEGKQKVTAMRMESTAISKGKAPWSVWGQLVREAVVDKISLGNSCLEQNSSHSQGTKAAKKQTWSETDVASS